MIHFPDLLENAVELASYYEPVPNIIEESIPHAMLIEDEIVGTGRWSIDREAIYEHEGRYWRVWYAEPATENQDWDKNDYSVHEVKPVIVEVRKFVSV